MHNHCHCDHDLKYCDHCDVVYCKKCSREWGIYKTWTPYYPYYLAQPYTVTTGATTSATTTCDSNTTGSVTSDKFFIAAHNHS